MGTGFFAYHYWWNKEGRHINYDFATEISVPAFLGTNYAFSKSGCGKNEAICKCNDLVGKKFQKAKDKSNEDRIKQIDFTK